MRTRQNPSHSGEKYSDLVCFSHLRWNFVYQRPQHLLSRFAMQRRVFYVEEPFIGDGPSRLDASVGNSGVVVVVPHLSSTDEVSSTLSALLDEFFVAQRIHSYVLWYYTPMPLPWTRHLQPLAVVYDCMDELSAFKGAPAEMRDRESELLHWADVVFTGGYTLYEAKRHQHPNIYAFPSSIDARHFASARTMDVEPEDQSAIPGVRLGFFGVIDERMDLGLVEAVALARPDWHLIMVGPVVKIDPANLPRLANIHYLGMKSYEDLPAYISGWDVALLPFAHNDSTRFISPTKTPEYLAAGLPVVSTSIRDVVRPYGEANLVYIADTAEDFIAAAEKAVTEDGVERLQRVDLLLAQTSWSRTWGRMAELLEDAISARAPTKRPKPTPSRSLAAAAGGAD